MALPGSLVVGSDPDVVAVATALLGKGNAADAVAAGVFAAGGLHASVLLGPVQVLLAGAGAGLRAVDGRARQPGLGNPRPRGFLSEEDVPAAARVGVPALPAALAALVSTYGRASLGAVLAPAIDLARSRSEGRAMVLDRLSRRGPPALSERGIGDEFEAAAGRMALGLLSRRDLEEVRPVVSAASTRGNAGGRSLITVPWGGSSVREQSASPMPGEAVRVIACADRNGMVAVACYAAPHEGLAIEPLGLTAPYCATPVMRGKTRVKPGEPRSSAAPIALLFSPAEGVVDLAGGVEGNPRAERLLGSWLEDWQPSSPLIRTNAAVPEGLVAMERAGAGWTAVSRNGQGRPG
jgi:gamma-glutamyltranspeptidase/glutathione hydrolase